MRGSIISADASPAPSSGTHSGCGSERGAAEAYGPMVTPARGLEEAKVEGGEHAASALTARVEVTMPAA